MKLSIIIPNYNSSKSIGDTLDSLIGKRVPIYELIVIDDASMGNTLEYAKRYPIKIFKILRSKFGHGKTRNLGAKLARGEYLVCITQDAIPANNNWLANLLVNLKKEDVAGAFGRQLPNKTADPLDVFNYNKDYPNKRRIISTDIVGVAEEVRENNCGIIIKPKDSLALAEAIIKLLENPKLAKKMGENGRKFVENKYSWEQIMEKIEQVYKEVCI